MPGTAIMIFELANDFHIALAALPKAHPRHDMLGLLAEAIDRDLDFLGRHPMTLFQCLWNSCWWYDRPEEDAHCDPTDAATPGEARPSKTGAALHEQMEAWRSAKRRLPSHAWIRSHRPPAVPLGTGLRGVFRGHRNPIRCVACSCNGHLIASGDGAKSVDSTARVYNLRTGAETVLRGRIDWAADPANRECQYDVCALAFSPDSRWLATGSRDWSLRLWDLRAAREVWRRRDHKASVEAVAFSHDGARIASGGGTDLLHGLDGTIRICSAGTGEPLRCLRGHEGCITCVVFSHNDRRIVSGSEDATVRVWELETERQSLCLNLDSCVTSAALLGGNRVVVGTNAGTVSIWDIAAGTQELSFAAHETGMSCVTVSSDGRFIATASGNIRIWRIDGVNVTLQHQFDMDANAAAFLPGAQKIVTGGHDRTVRLWDCRTTSRVTRPLALGGLRVEEMIAPCAPSPYLATASSDGATDLWDTQAARKICRLAETRPGAGTLQPVFSWDGRRLAVGCKDGQIRVWDPAAGRMVSSIPYDGERISRMAFGSDRYLAIGDVDGTVCIWDLARVRRCLRLQAHRQPVTGLLFVKAWLGTRDGAGHERWWDLRTRRCQHERRIASEPGPDTTAWYPERYRFRLNRKFDCQGVHYWLNETPVLDWDTRIPAAWIPDIIQNAVPTGTGERWAAVSEPNGHLWIFSVETFQDEKPVSKGQTESESADLVRFFLDQSAGETLPMKAEAQRRLKRQEQDQARHGPLLSRVNRSLAGCGRPALRIPKHAASPAEVLVALCELGDDAVRATEIELDNAVCHGKIYVKRGRIVHAHAGDRTGAEALSELLDRQHCVVRIRRCSEFPAATIERALTLVVIEWAEQRNATGRLLDEIWGDP